jgi:type IV secretory pathway protease TraF
MKLKINQKKFLFASLVIIFIATLLASNYEVMRNHTESLPYKYVVLEKGKIPTKRGQVFAFKVYNNAQYHNEKALNFIKLVGGLPGDKIEVKGGNVYFDGKIYPDIKQAPLTLQEVFVAVNMARISHPQDLERRKITIEDREVFVAGKSIGIAKPFTKKFENFLKNSSDGKKYGENYELHPIRINVIPSKKFFAYTPHKDSFDSRYQEIGLIDEKDIIGTAVLTF